MKRRTSVMRVAAALSALAVTVGFTSSVSAYGESVVGDQTPTVAERVVLGEFDMGDGAHVVVYDASSKALMSEGEYEEYQAELAELRERFPDIVDFNEGRTDMLITPPGGGEPYLVEGIYDIRETYGIEYDMTPRLIVNGDYGDPFFAMAAAGHTNPKNGDPCTNVYSARNCLSVVGMSSGGTHETQQGRTCTITIEIRSHNDYCTSCGALVGSGTHGCYEIHTAPNNYCGMSHKLH